MLKETRRYLVVKALPEREYELNKKFNEYYSIGSVVALNEDQCAKVPGILVEKNLMTLVDEEIKNCLKRIKP